MTDTYDYDAFGNLIHQTGSTPNNYLFAGEQYDWDLGLYYNRARYLELARAGSGYGYLRGRSRVPTNFAKYLYANSDPANGIDPSGHDLVDALGATAVASIVSGIAVFQITGSFRAAFFGGAGAGLVTLAILSGQPTFIRNTLIGGAANGFFQAVGNEYEIRYLGKQIPPAIYFQRVVEAFGSGAINGFANAMFPFGADSGNIAASFYTVTNTILTNVAQGKPWWDGVSVAFILAGLNGVTRFNLTGKIPYPEIEQLVRTTVVKTISTALKPIAREFIKSVDPNLAKSLFAN